MKTFGFFSIANQFRYGLLLIVGLSVLCTGSVLIVLSFQAQLQLLDVVQRERSQAVAGEINAYIDDLQRKLGFLARVRGLSTLSPDIQRNLLEGLTRHNSAYETVAIVDKRGQVMAAVAPYSPLPRENQADSLAFIRAFKEQEDFFGSVEFDPVVQLPLVTMSVPIRNNQDEVDGALLAKVNLEFLWFVVSKTAVGRTGYTYIIDERQFLVAQKGDLPETFSLENLSDRPFIQKLISEVTTPVTTYRGLRGIDVLGTSAHIESVYWHVVVELPLTEAYAPVNRMLLVMVSALVFTVIGTVGIGILFSRQIISPLRRLTEASSQISAGNLAVKVNVHSRNELGILATTFNGMTARLRELISGLEQNVAELKRTGEALRESEERYRTLFDYAPMGIGLATFEGQVLAVNATMLQMYGYSLEEFMQIDLKEVYQNPEDRKRLVEHIQQEGLVRDFEIEFKCKDDTNFYGSVTINQITLGGERGLLTMTQDVTERKRAEERIKNQNILLEQAVQEKQREMEALFERLLRQEKLATIGQIAGNIAHELRNPLGAVKQSIFYLKRLYHRGQLDASNPKVKAHLELIEAELDTSERVISDLLQMTRTKPLQREQTDLRLTIVDAADRCHLPERVQLNIELHPEPFPVWADPLQLRQVLINLLFNAVQSIEQQGSITIRAKQLTEEASCVIEIEDTGAGIEPDALSKVFEALYTTKNTGTGLGLSICKQIIENHHGQISLRSQIGQGTTVSIILPEE